MKRTTPIVLNLLILNGLMYCAQIFLKDINVNEWGSLHYVTSPLFKPHQFVTHMFMHDTSGLTHILFNMFGLWMFGTFMENYIGSKRFLIFYLICGLGAAIFTQFTIPYSANVYAKSAEVVAYANENSFTAAQIIEEYKKGYAMLGASGAIMGIMAAFAYLFPNTELYVMFVPIPLKAKFVIPIYILIDLFGGIRPSQGDNVGHFAHLGGALIGFLLMFYWNKTNRKTFY